MLNARVQGKRSGCLMKTIGRDRLCRLFIITAVAIVGETSLCEIASLAEDAPGRPSFPLEVNAKPAVGNIAGIKLSISHHYLLAGVHYKGEEVWTGSQNPRPPRTFDSEIEDFAMLLRLSTLQPITTKQDWADYQTYGQTAYPRPDNRWLTMSFFPRTYAANKGTLQPIVNRNMEDEPKWGPFILQDMDLYGLKHAKSKQQENEKGSSSQTDEFFYDPTTWGTFIRCANYHRKVSPFDPLSSCEHLFIVPELQTVVSVHCKKEDLSRWREIEGAIRIIAHSFIVK